MKKNKFFLVIFSLLTGLVLRLMTIDQSFWLDEAISVQAATKYSALTLLTQFMPKDFNPPLYYLILHFWLKIFPPTEFFIRLPSVIFGILTSLFIYKIYKLVFKNAKGALLSFALLLTSPLHIYYSQEARMYSLATMLVSASMYCFIKFLKKKNIQNILCYGFYAILMLYSHYLCWLVLFTQFFYLLIWQKDKLKTLFALYFLVFTFYLPWLPTFFNQLKIGRRVSFENIVWRNIAGSLSLKTISLLPVKFIIGRTSFENKNLYFTAVLGLILFFAFLLFQAIREKQNQLIKLLWSWLIFPPLFGILISFKIPVFSYFRFLFCLPAFYLLTSRGILAFKKSKGLIIMLVLTVNLFFSSWYLLNQNFHRENWKEAIKILHRQNVNKAPVLILQNITAPFDYYDKKESKVVFFSQKEILTTKDTVWLIPYAQPIFDPQDLTRLFLKKEGFQRSYEEHFRGVTLERWQKTS